MGSRLESRIKFSLTAQGHLCRLLSLGVGEGDDLELLLSLSSDQP